MGIIRQIRSDDCNVNNGLNIVPHESMLLYCDNTCELCVLNCNDTSKCSQNGLFEFTLISGAKETIINCTGIGSCKAAHFFVGNIGNIRNIGDVANQGNYSSYNVTRESYKLTIYCTGTNACEDTDFMITGNFKDNIVLDATGNNDNNNIAECHITVTIQDDQTFIVNCGDYMDNCIETEIDCISGSCLCDSLYCPYIKSMCF